MTPRTTPRTRCLACSRSLDGPLAVWGRYRRIRHPGVALAIFLTWLAVPAVQAEDMAPSRRVAEQFERAATAIVEQEPLTVEAMEAALVLLAQAVEIDSKNVRIWQTLVRMAEYAERYELRQRALRELTRLDPTDEAARLLYLNAVLNRYQTIEDLTRAYEKLLAPSNRARLGGPVASRLADDFAMLLGRAGDTEGFAKWLAESVSLDPANRKAVATATGFFRKHASEVYGEAELLTTLLRADPSDTTTLAALAELMLDHGAYEGAARLYRMVIRIQAVSGRRAAGGLIADRAVALWGAGDAIAALELLKSRQRYLDAVSRAATKRDNPNITAIELARQPASPMSSTLATVRAVIRTSNGDELAPDALRAAVSAYQIEIDGASPASEADSESVARSALEAAILLLWLDGDIEQAEALIQRARRVLPDGCLDDLAEARFEGWLALRRGDALGAIEHLAPIADRDLTSRVGLALAQLERGMRRAAARGLLTVYTGQPGTLLGVWAAQRLGRILGQPVGSSPLAQRLEGLAAAIPVVFDRLADEPTQVLSLRIRSPQRTFGAFEPIVVELEVTNRAPVPLAVDIEGPIRPSIVLYSTARISGHPRIDELSPIVVAIDKRLRLEPQERYVIPIDIRRGELEQVLDGFPLPGATITVRGIINVAVTPHGGLRPSLFGSEVESTPIRVNGIRLNTKWVERAMTEVLDPDPFEDLDTMALLAHAVAIADPEMIGDGEGSKRLLQDAARLLAEGFGKLDEMSRAWLLAVLPRNDRQRLEPIRAMARQDERKIVRIAILLYTLRGPDDPMIDAARRSGDPDLKTLATLMARAAAEAATQDLP